ncbi:MAG: FtsX-like permease family protein [Christensenellaceae bacterium]
MRITTSLAYSQLKTNRSRTMWSLAAIALSTALLVAVCSFVASGNAMIVNFLGTDYGEYGQSYIRLLLVPATLFAVIIITMSVVVISNVFRVSANDRIAQFGILKCVGATEKQILSTVIYESVFLSAVGIPIGVVLGQLLSFLGINVANIFLEELNQLTNIMIKEFSLSLNFVFSWQALLVGAIISFFTVLFSALRPARKASKVSAVDSVKGTGTVKVSKNKTRSNPIVQKLFGYEGVLASKNLKRNRQNFRATVIALTAGVVLFVSLGGISQQAGKLQDFMRLKVDQTVISEYTSARIREDNEITGREESIYLNPIDSDIGNIVAAKLSAYDGKPVFGMGLDLETYYTVLPKEFISTNMKDVLAETEQDTYELPVEIIPLDASNYQLLCDKAGVPLGSNILLNNYSYNDMGTEISIAPYQTSLETITLFKADGSQKEISIDGVLTAEDMPKELFYFNTNPVRLVVEQAEVRGYSWYSAPDNEAEFISFANNILAEMFPQSEDADYMEEGFSVRVYKIDDYIKVMNIAILLVSVFMYSFVILLMLIGFTNVISTMSTNVLMRAREFAVLQSVGMTPKGIKRMLSLESILCSIKALLLGLPIGIVITYLINLPIRTMYPIPYEFPLMPILLCSMGVLAITLGTTICASHKLRKQNIIETIRTQSGR